MLPTIEEKCGMFLAESKGKPIMKALPRTGEGFRKVKIRKKKIDSNFDKTFNDSFFTEYNDIRSRSLFVNGNIAPAEDEELFYIFPVDDYRFMYSPQISDSSDDYKKTFDKIITSIGESNGMEIFKDMLKLSYRYDNLPHAIDLGCEIIIYDIAHYYAIRKTLIDDYSKWFYNISS